MSGRVAAGSSVHSAAANFPTVFQHHWVEVIRTGEITGQMSTVLGELNKQIADSRATTRKVKGALMYPIILICFAVGAVTGMLWFVIPTFAKMFKDMGAELPGVTQFVVDFSGYVSHYGIYATMDVIATPWASGSMEKPKPAGGCTSAWASDPHGRRSHRAIGHVSLLLQHRAVAEERHPHAGNAERAGGHLSDQPRLPRRAGAGATAWRPAAPRASLEETGLFTTLMTNMVRIGEESGQLAQVMEQIGPYYKEKMETMITRVTKLLEPVIIMGMGTTVAGLMLSIYLPMFEMAGKVH